MLKTEKLIGAIQVRCPYCGTEQQVYFEGNYNKNFINACGDEDTAGCDKHFAVFIQHTPTEELYISQLQVTAKVCKISEPIQFDDEEDRYDGTCLNMFGLFKEEMVQEFLEWNPDEPKAKAMRAMNILSDVQEILSYAENGTERMSPDTFERVRQMLNQSKFWMSEVRQSL